LGVHRGVDSTTNEIAILIRHDDPGRATACREF
jgi:hypothetical protein